MLTILFIVLLFLLVGKTISFAIKATWGITKICFASLFFLVVVALALAGCVAIAVPVLAVVGIIALIVPKHI